MLHPRLYKKDSKGKARFWQVETDDAGSYRTISGLTLGNPVTSEWTICKPKNVGRNNETTAEVQCDREVAALYERKRDSHYVETMFDIDNERKYFEVKLANIYNTKTKKLLFTAAHPVVYSQPKLDGLRGPTTAAGSFSRKGNEFKAVKFISERLAAIFVDYPGLVFDGELYNHEYRGDFNEIVSVIKNGGGPDAVARAQQLVQLHVYDLYDPARPNDKFYARNLRVQALLNRYGIDPEIVVWVPATPVKSFEELDALYERLLEEEYEGQMVLLDTEYQHRRTDDTLKRKETDEKEFPLIRVEEGKGNWAGYAKRVYVRLENGSECKGGLMGSQPYLHGVLAEADEYENGTATMLFQGRTPDGQLRFPRAKRLYKGPRDD